MGCRVERGSATVAAIAPIGEVSDSFANTPNAERFHLWAERGPVNPPLSPDPFWFGQFRQVPPPGLGQAATKRRVIRPLAEPVWRLRRAIDQKTIDAVPQHFLPAPGVLDHQWRAGRQRLKSHPGPILPGGCWRNSFCETRNHGVAGEARNPRQQVRTLDLIG
jgi:hypothetical protein